MRKIFVDLGANRGDITDLLFRSTQNFDFEVFSFEPNSKFIEALSSKPYAVNHLKTVAWIEDGHVDFRVDNSNIAHGSTCILSKRTGELASKSAMTSVDISNWFKKNFSKSDFIVLKMDIEGAEYEVLGKMHSEGTLDMIDTLYLDTHPNSKLNVSDETWRRYNLLLSTALSSFKGNILLNPDWHKAEVFSDMIRRSNS
jgi:FkbM family methyltransferase